VPTKQIQADQKIASTVEVIKQDGALGAIAAPSRDPDIFYYKGNKVLLEVDEVSELGVHIKKVAKAGCCPCPPRNYKGTNLLGKFPSMPNQQNSYGKTDEVQLRAERPQVRQAPLLHVRPHADRPDVQGSRVAYAEGYTNTLVRRVSRCPSPTRPDQDICMTGRHWRQGQGTLGGRGPA
jgi:hypothetical protein